MNWINLAWNRDQWQALLNTVINPYVLQKWGNILSSWEVISSPVHTGSIKIVGRFLFPQKQPPLILVVYTIAKHITVLTILQ